VRFTDHLFVSLLEAAPDAVVCVRGNGDIALVNAQAERLFGYSRAELVGQQVEVLIPDAVRAVHPAHRATYMADPKPRPMGVGMELSARRRDGGTFPAEISLSAIETGDEFLVMAAVRDVTERLELLAERERLKSLAERERLESQLQRSQQLESLGQLAGGVAHDFNNLLAVISIHAAFVSDELAKEISAVDLKPVRDDMAQIQRAAERAAGLTHQLLAFARRDVVQPRVLNLNKVIESVHQLLLRTLGEHIQLSISLSGDLHAVMVDQGLIEQVLVNLAVNARDAMPSGGTLSVVTSNIDIDTAYAASRIGLMTGRYACMKISDTGTGMTREVIDHAFEPFFSTKPRGEGTGLGLATVYGIITQFGGHTQIYSEPGLGTTFTILLPAVERGAERGAEHGAGQVAPPQATIRGGEGETVLVVEDEDAMREVTRRILARNGYRVLAAASGPEAIETAASQPGGIDVLLTDVVMPEMSGKEAAERIGALRPDMKILFMSGYTQGLLDIQGILREDVNLIEKPFTEKSLLAKIRQVIAFGTKPVPR